MDDTLRLRKYYRNSWVISLIFFSCMMTFSFFATFFSERNFLAALVFAGIGGGLVVLSGMMLLVYHWKSLSIQEKTIIQTGILHRREITFADMVSVRWRTFPAGGSVVLRSSTNKIKINFENFELEQRRQLIQLLRLSLPQLIQQDWERFCLRNALPLLKDNKNAPLQEGEILITRRCLDLIFLTATSLSMVFGIGCAWLIQNPIFLVLPLTLLVPWPLMRFFMPPKGMRCKKMTTPEKRYFLLMWIWYIISIMIIIQLSNNHPGLSMGLSIVWIAGLLYLAYRLERCQETDKDAVTAAVREWDRLMAINRRSIEK